MTSAKAAIFAERQLCKKLAGLIASQKTHPARRFHQHAHLRCAIEPFPLIDAPAKNGAQHLEQPIYCVTPRLKVLKVVEPPQRKGGGRVADVKELVAKLRNGAKVIQ